METELARLSAIPATINPRSRVHADRGLGIFHINAITRAEFYCSIHANITGYRRASFLYDKFFYDKGTCSKASMLAFEQVHLS
jgi:hypothetical protein